MLFTFQTKNERLIKADGVTSEVLMEDPQKRLAEVSCSKRNEIVGADRIVSQQKITVIVSHVIFRVVRISCGL